MDPVLQEVLWDCGWMACPRGLQADEEPGLACRRSGSWFRLRLNIMKESREVRLLLCFHVGEKQERSPPS